MKLELFLTNEFVLRRFSYCVTLCDFGGLRFCHDPVVNGGSIKQNDENADEPTTQGDDDGDGRIQSATAQDHDEPTTDASETRNQPNANRRQPDD